MFRTEGKRIEAVSCTLLFVVRTEVLNGVRN